MFDNTMSVEQWKEQKQAERNDAFKAQQSGMEEVLSSGKALTEYLVGRGRLGSHITSGNAAIVLKQVPQARAVLSFEDWSRYGRRVNKGAVGIPQLVRLNGYYAVEKQFDVSQTYGNKPYPTPTIPPEQIPAAIDVLREISLVPVVLNADPNLAPGNAPQEDAIFYPSAYPWEEVLRNLPSQIVASAIQNLIPDHVESEYAKLMGLAVSVELCGRFGLEPPRHAEEQLGNFRAHIPEGEERRALEDIREFSNALADPVCRAISLQRGAPEPSKLER